MSQHWSLKFLKHRTWSARFCPPIWVLELSKCYIWSKNSWNWLIELQTFKSSPQTSRKSCNSILWSKLRLFTYFMEFITFSITYFDQLLLIFTKNPILIPFKHGLTVFPFVDSTLNWGFYTGTEGKGMVSHMNPSKH